MLCPKFRVSTKPTVEPVTVEELKAYLKVRHQLEDTLVQDAIQAARSHAEAFTRRSIPAQVLEVFLDVWPGDGVVYLPRPPCRGLTSVEVLPAAGGAYAAAVVSDFILDAVDEDQPATVRLKAGGTLPAYRDEPNAIKLTVAAGYATPADEPPDIRSAVRLLAGHLFKNRMPLSEGAQPAKLAFSVDALLWPWRVLRFDL